MKQYFSGTRITLPSGRTGYHGHWGVCGIPELGQIHAAFSTRASGRGTLTAGWGENAAPAQCGPLLQAALSCTPWELSAPMVLPTEMPGARLQFPCRPELLLTLAAAVPGGTGPARPCRRRWAAPLRPRGRHRQGSATASADRDVMREGMG